MSWGSFLVGFLAGAATIVVVNSYAASPPRLPAPRR